LARPFHAASGGCISSAELALTKYERIVWICNTFNTYGKDKCGSQQIPESVLMEKTAEVLRMGEFDAAALKASIAEITVPERNRLNFRFHDGHEVPAEWYTTRRDSWTPEMRESARQKALAQHRGEGYN